MSKEVVIAAVGDLLMKPLLVRAMNVTDTSDSKDSYNAFKSVFQPVSRYLKKADVTIGNLETTFAGGENFTAKRKHPKTRNPIFKTPDSFAPALKSVGFDVLTTANNHCMDYGITGLKRTLDILDQNKIAHVGTYRTQEESEELCIQQVNGIKIGILSYTRHTNKIPIPNGQPAGVKMMQRESIKEDLKKLREHADFIVVAMHFGFEYKRKPAKHQKEWVRFLFQHGADVVLGAHPHILQPAEFQTVTDISGRTRKRFVIYSLGNFVSTRLGKTDSTITSMIVQIKIRQSKDGVAELIGVQYVPTLVHFEKDKSVHILPLNRKRSAKISSVDDISRMDRALLKTQNMYDGVMEMVSGESDDTLI